MSHRIPLLPVALATALAAAVVATVPGTAAAQTDPPEQVDSNVKGIVGLGLIGAELGFVIPAAAGLHETWAFIVFPVVGAVGGGLAGHFLIEENNATEVAVAMLATGLALVIPATVLTAKFTSYDPSRDEPPPPPGGPAAADREGAAPGERLARRLPSPPARLRPTDLLARSGVLRLAPDGLRLGVPGLHLRPDLNRSEADLYGIDQRLVVHLPLFSGSF